MDDRKSGIPAATLMPAPATTIIRFAFANSLIVFLHSSEEDIPSIARSSTSYGRLDSTIAGGGLLRTRISTANGGEETTIVDRVGEGGGFMTSMMGNIISGSVLSFFVVGVSLGDIHSQNRGNGWLHILRSKSKFSDEIF